MKTVLKTGVLGLTMLFCIHLGAQTISKCDKKFAEKMAPLGMFIVKANELAQTKATDGAVKTNAAMMVESHTRSNAELRKLAASKNIVVPSVITGNQERVYKKLTKYEGKTFDKKFAHLMMKNHRTTVCKLKKEARRSKDAELKAWAAAQLQVHEKHRDMWKEACKNIK